jgi:hypothetical protein
MSDLPWSRAGSLALAAARAGYAARGFVYLSIGVLAALSALDIGGSPQGPVGAIAALALMPLGEWWLILIGAGLGCFAAWRALQAFGDADSQGRTPQALVQRTGQAISGVIYAGLSASMLKLTDTLEDLGEADDQQSASTQAAMVLTLPHGDIALVMVGVFVLGAGVANLLHSTQTHFRSGLDCSPRLKRWAKPIGRLGYFSRGFAFCLIGVQLVRAAWDTRASEARGLGGALQALESQPGGTLVLLVVAVGLAAFGVFGLFEAGYRRLSLPGASDT